MSLDCSAFDEQTRKAILNLVDAELVKPQTIYPKEVIEEIGLDLRKCKNISPKKPVKSIGAEGPQAVTQRSFKQQDDDVPRAKSGRKLSKYQVFLGGCMRSEEKGGRALPMKDCITEWKAQKEQN